MIAPETEDYLEEIGLKEQISNFKINFRIIEKYQKSKSEYDIKSNLKQIEETLSKMGKHELI
jgi:hypothetical protein